LGIDSAKAGPGRRRILLLEGRTLGHGTGRTVKRILLIEDDLLFRKSLSTYIASLGYQVYTADSGERGLQVLEQEPVDLMVADYNLPGITGIDVIRTARARGVEIPIVLVSAGLTGETETEARKHRVSAVLRKSSEHLQQLHPTISALLR
jgi:two-component system response regulator PhoP